MSKKIKFEDLGLSDEILKGLYTYGFDIPSEIQINGIKAIITGKDCILQSQSGTGKTGTYSLGILQRIDPSEKSIQCIIVVPTRELAEQVYEVTSHLSKFMGIRISTCMGGTNMKDTSLIIKNKPQLIIGTIGRINHMIESNVLNTNCIKTLVIDEADTILLGNFKTKVTDIMSAIKSDYQICLLSATMPPNVQDLMRQFTRDPIKILLRKSQINVNSIKQFYIDVEKEDYKLEVLLDLYKIVQTSQTIIYCNTINKVEWLAEKLKENDFPITWIHGEISQLDRNDIVKKFRSGENRILLTTDLLSRGIDIPEISLVVNYDLPISKENYIHRVGRSGRFGRKGLAINFIKSEDDGDIKNFTRIKQYFNLKIEELPSNVIEYL
jgi:superfamily II DNA/RNA helicase